jgi:hypothetical protein
MTIVAVASRFPADPEGFAENAQEWGELPTIRHRKKTGGRKKGSKNKKTLERAKVIAAIKASGTDPVSFFADLLRNESAPLDLRFQAAKELAPFMHPKLASVESRTGGRTHEDRLEAARKLLSDD